MMSEATEENPPISELASIDCRCVPLSEWQPEDRTAFERAIAQGDLFDTGPAAHWSAQTRGKVVRGVGRFLTFARGHALMRVLADPDSFKARVGAFLTELESVNASYTVLGRIEELDHAIRVMAPSFDRRWLQELLGRLRRRAHPVGNKHARVRPAREVFQHGLQLMQQAEAAETLPQLKRAVIYRNGLMIAVLMARVPRLGNLAALSVATSLIEREGQYFLALNAEETKGRRQPLMVPLPLALASAVRRYLEHWRPILLTRGGRAPLSKLSALWVSREGTAMAAVTIHAQIVKATQQRFGVRIPPHLFRDCAATSIADEDPKHVGIIKPVLQHQDHRTGERHYNQAHMLQASRRYSATVLELLKEATEAR